MKNNVIKGILFLIAFILFFSFGVVQAKIFNFAKAKVKVLSLLDRFFWPKSYNLRSIAEGIKEDGLESLTAIVFDRVYKALPEISNEVAENCRNYDYKSGVPRCVSKIPGPLVRGGNFLLFFIKGKAEFSRQGEKPERIDYLQSVQIMDNGEIQSDGWRIFDYYLPESLLLNLKYFSSIMRPVCPSDEPLIILSGAKKNIINCAAKIERLSSFVKGLPQDESSYGEREEEEYVDVGYQNVGETTSVSEIIKNVGYYKENEQPVIATKEDLDWFKAKLASGN